MKKKISLLLLAVLFLFSSQTVLAEEYLIVDRDEQSSGVLTTQYTEDGSWDLFYDAETKKYKIVYTITSDAPDEITLDLSKAKEVLVKHAEEELFADEGLDDYIKESRSKGYNSLVFELDGASFKLYYDTMKVEILSGPGSVFSFNVIVNNNSGKTYTYKEGSLIVATSKQEESNSDVIGFDGQKLGEYTIVDKLVIGYTQGKDDTLINSLIDRMFENEPVKGYQGYVDENGNITSYIKKINISKGSEVVKIKNGYYYKVGNYYISVPSNKVDTESLTIIEDLVDVKTLAFDAKGNKVHSYYDRFTMSVSECQEKLKKYVKKNYEDNLSLLVIEEFNIRYGTSYENLADFSDDDMEKLIVELFKTNMYEIGEIEVAKSTKYDYFYKYILSIIITDTTTYDETYGKDSVVVKNGREYNNDEWATLSNGITTVGNYMKEKVNNNDSGIYKETDLFLNSTVGKIETGKTSSFVYGINIDYYANNMYQNYKYNYYAAFKMIAEKYNVYVNYIDVDGKVIANQDYYSGIYTGEDYKTAAKTIEGYELVRVDGEATGVMADKDVVVTYVYEYVLGQGGDDIDTEPIVVQTGSEIDYSLMTSAFITASLIVLALRTKKKNN